MTKHPSTMADQELEYALKAFDSDMMREPAEQALAELRLALAKEKQAIVETYERRRTVTPEMIRAGVAALENWQGVAHDSMLVEQVFLAMEAARD